MEQAEPANRSAKQERHGLPLTVQRIRGLETAAELLGGQVPLADAIGIDPRSLRAKLHAGRGISDADLWCAIRALRVRAARVSDLADRLRALIEGDAA